MKHTCFIHIKTTYRVNNVLFHDKKGTVSVISPLVEGAGTVPLR